MQRLNSLINSNPGLKTLAAKTENVLLLQKKWAALAPPPFNSLSRPGPLNMGQMTVYTGNGAVAAKLKLLAPGLLKKLQNEGVEVTAIRVQVQVESKPRAPAAPRRGISETTRSRLAELAGKLPESHLKSALERLARRARG